MGLFGAIGRETRGAFRSIGYDLRRSPRIKRVGVIAVTAVAGGVIATGALLREPVPGMVGLDDAGSDITDGWFGLGADTTGQDAESSSEAPAETATEAAADPRPETASDEVQARGRTAGPGLGDPDLVPVGEDRTSGPRGEEGGEASPSPTATGSPTDEPTTDAPTTTAPTEEPTTEAPTSPEPTPSATMTTTAPSSDQSSEPSAEQAMRVPTAPTPRKAPIGG